MTVRPVVQYLSPAESRRNTLIRYLARIEEAYDDGALNRNDADLAFAGALLKWSTTVEGTIERVFFATLMGRAEYGDRRVGGRVQIKSEVVARQVVHGSLKYLDWLPMDVTRNRAETFLSSGLPFSMLSTAELDTLRRIHVIRNAVAHDSAHARKKFERIVLMGRSLPPRQTQPGGYLRGQHSPGVSRLVNLMNESQLALRKLSM